jgi:hypothetical protein
MQNAAARVGCFVAPNRFASGIVIEYHTTGLLENFM